MLFEHGDPADAMYVVLRGELEAYGVHDQRELSLSHVGLGSTVGEIQLLTSGTTRRPASSMATRMAGDVPIIE